jgi:hypothetical protein
VSDLHAHLLAATGDRFNNWHIAANQRGAALRAVVELHKPVTFWRPWSGEPTACEHCSMLLQAAGAPDPVPYPCLTVVEIARELGVDGA